MKEIIFLIFSSLYTFLVGGIHKKFLVEKVFGIVPEETKFLCLKKKKGKRNERNVRGSYFVPWNIIEQAYNTITSTLDICTLSHELFVVRFLSSALLTDYQMNLMPLIALNYFAHEDQPQDSATNKAKKGMESEREQLNDKKYPTDNPNDKADLKTPEQFIGPNSNQDLKLPDMFPKLLLDFIKNYKPIMMKEKIPKMEDSWNKVKDDIISERMTYNDLFPGEELKVQSSPVDGRILVPKVLNGLFSKKCCDLLEDARFSFLHAELSKVEAPVETLMLPKQHEVAGIAWRESDDKSQVDSEDGKAHHPSVLPILHFESLRVTA